VAEEELTIEGMAIDEDTLTEVVGAGISTGVEALGKGERNADVDERCWTDVVGAGLLTEVVDLGGGTTRVDDARRCVDLDVVVDASPKLSAPKSISTSSLPSFVTSFRSKKCPMTLGDGCEDLCRSANPGRVKLETMFVVSSTQIQQRTATK